MTIPTVHFLSPAYNVIEKLGGKTVVADELGLNKSALSRWCAPRPEGTGGMVPQRYWPQLMEMARRQGVVITLQELAALEV